MPRIVAAVPDARFVVMGNGVEAARLRALAREGGVADRVLWLGPAEDPRPLYEALDVFALPSWDEAFGLVYTEAMAQGTPVIAGKGEGPEDFIEDGVSGYLAPVRDADALAAVLEGILDDQGGAAAVGRAGKAAAAALSWEHNARLTREMYGRVLGAAPDGGGTSPDAERPREEGSS